MNNKSTFKKAIIAMMISGCSYFSFGQIVLQEGFESGVFPPAGWSTLDEDTDVTDNWDTINLTGYSAGNLSGNFIAASRSWVGGTATNPDNWLITPQLNIAAANTKLIFSGLSTWGFPNGGSGDFLEVYVSTTGVATTDFSSVFSQNFVTETWEKIEVDLNAYMGQNIYIAFRHHNCTDQEYMGLDDIIVASPFEDINVVSVNLLSPYTVVPDSQGAAMDLAVRIANTGLLPVATFNVMTSIYMNANPVPVATYTTPVVATNPGDSIDVAVGTYNTSTAGDYFALHTIDAVNDAISSNDSIGNGMSVSTGEYARDNLGLVSIAGFPSSTGVRGNTFNITTNVALDSVLFAFDPTVAGVRVLVDVTKIDGTAGDTVTIGKSADLVVDQALVDFSAASGGIVVQTLAVTNMTGGKMILAPGTYFVGLRKPDTLSSMRLWFTDGIFTSGGSINRPIGGVFTDMTGAVPLVRAFVSPVVVPTITSSDADNIICSPSTITLTSSANTGNVWSTGATTKSITVSASGTYNVMADGVLSTDVVITVNSADAITLATGTNPTGCLGTDGKIDVTFGGAGNGTIMWSGTATSSMSGVTANATINNLTAGGYTVTYDNGNGCISNAMSVALSDPGAVIPVISASGATTFCPGGSVTLTSSATGGNIWSDLSTTDAITVTTSGSYYAVNTTTPGCVGTSNVIDVVAYSAPAVNAGADMAICAGESAFLFGSGASTYTWDNGVTDATTFTPASTTTYTVTGTDVNSCTATDAVTITVNPLPVITWTAIPQVCVYNSPITLTASPAGGIYSGSGVTGSSFDPAGLAVGTYSLDYELTATGCTSVSSQTVVVDSCLSINLLDQANLMIYPNPSTGKFTISSDNLNQYDVIEMRDQMGRIIGTWKINNVTMTIETKNIAKGNYFLVVRGSNGDMVKQVQLRD